MRNIRALLLGSIIAAVNGFVLWLWWATASAGGSMTIRSPLVIGLTIAVSVTQPLGALWMLYDCFRYEEKPWRRGILAIIPWFFAWHYFMRVRKRELAERTPIARRRNEGHSQAD